MIKHSIIVLKMNVQTTTKKKFKTAISKKKYFKIFSANLFVVKRGRVREGLGSPPLAGLGGAVALLGPAGVVVTRGCASGVA